MQTLEEQLNHALQGENRHSAHIDSFRERLAKDERIYTECLTFILKLQT